MEILCVYCVQLQEQYSHPISSINQGQIKNINYAVATPIESVNSIPTLTKEPKLMLLASHTPAAPLSGE